MIDSCVYDSQHGEIVDQTCEETARPFRVDGVKYGRMFDPDGGAMGVMPIQVHGSDFFKPEFDIFRQLFCEPDVTGRTPKESVIEKGRVNCDNVVSAFSKIDTDLILHYIGNHFGIVPPDVLVDTATKRT